MIDPLLVESLGFRLSVAATVGIALFASGIARRLKGPEWFKRVLSITVASQLGVAPLIIPVVGPMPLSSLPANVLAEPIAGFVMMWGSTVGVVAGLIGGWPAAILQAPVRLGVWWIMNVAESCSDLPLPRVSLPVIILVTLCMLALLGAHSSWRRSRRMLLRPVSAG
jgi:competence protein ComEC